MSQVSTSVKPSHDSLKLAEKIVNEELDSERNNISLKHYYSKLMDQLEIDGIPKQKISTIGSLLVRQKKAATLKLPVEDVSIGSWWFDVARERDCIDLSFSHTNATDAERENSSINTKNNKMLLLCDNIIDICRTIKEKSTKCDELEKIFGEKQMTEFYRQQNTMIDNCKNSIDTKTKIPHNTELFLLECLATVMGNTNKCGQIFQQIIMTHMEEQCKFLTQKQATKFQVGGKQSQLYLLKPTSRDFAIYEDYTGVQCTCGSWRVRPKADNASNWECYDCDMVMPKQHMPKCHNCQIPLYKDRIQHIIKTNKCDNCNETVDLPQVLIDQANIE